MHALFLIVRVDRPPISGGSNGACYICVASLSHIIYLACTERDLNNEEKSSEIYLKLDLVKANQIHPRKCHEGPRGE